MTEAIENPGPRRGRAAGIAWVAAAIVLALTLVLIARSLSQATASGSLQGQLKRGERVAAPALPTRPLTGSPLPTTPVFGTPDRAGDVVVVNFWASWCVACREEAPALRRVWQEYREQGVVFVGVNAQDAEQDARRFVKEHKADYAMVRGRQRDLNAWGMEAFPETFVVGRDGMIASKIVGAADERMLVEAIEEELRRRP